MSPDGSQKMEADMQGCSIDITWRWCGADTQRWIDRRAGRCHRFMSITCRNSDHLKPSIVHQQIAVSNCSSTARLVSRYSSILESSRGLVSSVSSSLLMSRGTVRDYISASTSSSTIGIWPKLHFANRHETQIYRYHRSTERQLLVSHDSDQVASC